MSYTYEDFENLHKSAEPTVQKNWFLLNEHGITDNDIDALCAYLTDHPEISCLSVDRNHISSSGARKLANVTSLTKLQINDNHIGDIGAEALAASSSIKSLYAARNGISDIGAKALAANMSITKLGLSGNNIGDKGAKAFAFYWHVTELDLSENHIGNEGAIAFGSNSSIIRLDLSSNQMGFNGLDILVASERHRHLYFDNNPISSSAYEKLRAKQDAVNFDNVDESELSETELSQSSPKSNISMMILEGFIIAAGITAVAVAFTVLNAATGGAAGLVLVGIGAAAILTGIGLFAYDVYKDKQAKQNESFDSMPEATI